MEIEISRHDWRALRTFEGDGSHLPGALRRLAAARTTAEAGAAYWEIDNVVVIQGRLSQSASAVVCCLMSALATAAPPARDEIVSLIALIANGYDEHVDIDAVGPVRLAEIRQEVTRGFVFFAELLETTGHAACIELVAVCGLTDPLLRERAGYVLEAAARLPKPARFSQVLANALAMVRDAADRPRAGC